MFVFFAGNMEKNEQNDFSLSDTETCELLKITRPTIITLRQKLVTLGIIQYQSKNGLPGHYKILSEYSPKLSAFENPKTYKESSTIKRVQKTIQKKKKTAVKSLQKTSPSIENSPNSLNNSEDFLKICRLPTPI